MPSTIRQLGKDPSSDQRLSWGFQRDDISTDLIIWPDGITASRGRKSIMRQQSGVQAKFLCYVIPNAHLSSLLIFYFSCSYSIKARTSPCWTGCSVIWPTIGADMPCSGLDSAVDRLAPSNMQYAVIGPRRSVPRRRIVFIAFDLQDKVSVH